MTTKLENFRLSSEKCNDLEKESKQENISVSELIRRKLDAYDKFVKKLQINSNKINK